MHLGHNGGLAETTTRVCLLSSHGMLVLKVDTGRHLVLLDGVCLLPRFFDVAERLDLDVILRIGKSLQFGLLRRQEFYSISRIFIYMDASFIHWTCIITVARFQTLLLVVIKRKFAARLRAVKRELGVLGYLQVMDLVVFALEHLQDTDPALVAVAPLRSAADVGVSTAGQVL